jgi:hypothetical protein
MLSRFNVVPDETPHARPGLPDSEFARAVERHEQAVVNAALHKAEVGLAKNNGVFPKREKLTRNETVAIARSVVAKHPVDMRGVNLGRATALQARAVAGAAVRGNVEVSSKTGSITIHLGGAR